MIPRDLLLVTISLLIWGIGEGMFAYFQPIYLQQLGADPVVIGGILGLIGVSMTITQAPAGWLADRFGSRPIMRASWVFGTVSIAVMAFSNSLTMFVVGMFLYGLTSWVIAPMNAYLASVRETWSVERALTVPSSLFNLGMVVGPIIGGVIAEASGIQTIYRVAIVLFTISTAVIFLTRKPAQEVHNEAVHQRPNLFKNRIFIGLLLLISVTTFALYLPQVLSSNFLQNEAGLSLRNIGLLGSIGSLGNTLIMIGLGSLRAPTGFLTGQILVGIFSFALWRGTSFSWFAIGYFFIGGFRLMRAMALAFTRNLIRPSEIGLAFGLVETANGIAIILAPILAGALYDIQPRLMYLVSLILICVLVGVNLLIRFIRERTPRTVPVTPQEETPK